MIKKKDIISLSIPRTCEAIRNPDLEMPLRYTSNLLYGVTVCYDRKTDFVLADVTTARSQLQRQLYGLTRALAPRNVTSSVTTIFDGVNEYHSILEIQRQQLEQIDNSNETNAFLQDDPLFDINQCQDISFLETEKQPLAQSRSLIKQQDFIKELNNGYENDLSNTKGTIDTLESSNLLRSLGRTKTTDELPPIDMDFNLGIDEFMSENETTMDKSVGDRTPSVYNEINFDLNFERQETPQLDSDDRNVVIPEMELPLIEDDAQNLKRTHENESEASLSDEEITEHISKKPKYVHGLSNVSKIRFDERIGLMTDALRYNSDNYNKNMDAKRKELGHTAQSKSGLTNIQEWERMLDFRDQPVFIQNCLLGLYVPSPDSSTSNPIFKFNSKNSMTPAVPAVERGRKLIHSLSSSRSSSVLSEEQGRRAVATDSSGSGFARRGSNSDSNPNILSGLDQIEEELEIGNVSNFWEDSNQNYNTLGIDLHLPPSSFGRNLSRTSTDSKDHVDILRQLNTRRSRTHVRGGGTSSIIQDETVASSLRPTFSLDSETAQQHQIMDNQTRKFYDYIVECASTVGKTTRSNPPFQKKVLFEDVIPSKVSTGEPLDFEDAEQIVKPASKRIAANAFLSILQLASRDSISLNQFSSSDDFGLMNGDDIIICV